MTLLWSCFLFEGLLENQIEDLDSIAGSKQVEKGRWLFREGQSAGALYILSSGAVELVAMVDKDFNLPIQMLRAAGDCCGISALMPPYFHNLSARCAKDAQVLILQRKDLQALFQKNNHLNLAIMANMSRRLLDHLNEARRELRIHFKILSDSSDV